MLIVPSLTVKSTSKSSVTLTPSAPLRRKMSSISEFLTFPSTCTTPNCLKKKPGPARVLTSEESLKILREKEKKKQEEEDAKERKRLNVKRSEG